MKHAKPAPLKSTITRSPAGELAKGSPAVSTTTTPSKATQRTTISVYEISPRCVDVFVLAIDAANKFTLSASRKGLPSRIDALRWAVDTIAEHERRARLTEEEPSP